MSATGSEHTLSATPLVTVITGASRGIGAATARRLAQDHNGRKTTQTKTDLNPLVIVLTYASNQQAAEAVAADVRTFGVDAHIVQANVADAGQVKDVFSVADNVGQLSALVNNAGVVGLIKPFADYSVERIAETVNVNLTGSLLCALEAVNRMQTDRGGAGGAIVNVSSRAASFGSPNEFVDYAATKGGIDSFTIGLATEVADKGIRVNAVRPGLIDTDIHAAAGAPNRVQELADRIPMKRGGTPDEIAASIAWLLSDEASYVTGALLDVGGGR